jgi:hypothetical protein
MIDCFKQKNSIAVHFYLMSYVGAVPIELTTMVF